MKKRQEWRWLLLAVGFAFFGWGVGPVLFADGAEKVKVLIVTGQNNHDWEADTRSLTATLLKTGRFEVEKSVSPPARPRANKGGKPSGPDLAAAKARETAREEAWLSWRPDFSKYDVVVSDYNGEAWPEAVRKSFEEYIRGGGGLVNVHAANNSFPNWPAFNQMTGLLWRPALFGERVTIDDATGEQVRRKRGEGPGAGHGQKHDFVVKVRRPEHPIMGGMPEEWLHAHDELYHGQRGPARDMEVLSSAYSDPKMRGTGEHEPITWVIPFGEGKCVTTVLGHKGRNAETHDALHCVGFQTVFARAVEYAATGKVTIPIPDRFPNKVQRLVEDPGMELIK